MLAVNVAAPRTVIGALRFSSYSLNSAARVRESDWACPTRPAVVRATLFEILNNFLTLLFAIKCPIVALWSAPTTTPPSNVMPTVLVPVLTASASAFI